jgi:hypothetical protein
VGSGGFGLVQSREQQGGAGFRQWPHHAHACPGRRQCDRAGCFEPGDCGSLRIEAAARAVGGNPWLIPFPAPLLLAAGAFSGWWARLRGKAAIFNAGKARELLHPDWSVAPDEVLPFSVFQPAIGLQAGFRSTADWYRAAGWL